MADPEIEAMSQVVAALDRSDLDSEARVRVLRWAIERYGLSVATPMPTTPVTSTKPSSMPDGQAEDRPSRTPDSRDAAEPTFEHFVDLFDAIDPKTDVDK